jgi:adenylate cyclase
MDHATPPSPARAAPQTGALRRARDWLAGRADGTLPEHARRELEAQRARNEILVGWIQAGLVATFALLYAMSRKTFPDSVAFRPVPWALGLYAGFVAWRLVLAYRGRLRLPQLLLSVVLDMALLMVTIWSFHLQYGQPPAFYLKAPTLFYVFIFIALRTLSLTPGLVLAAGIAAATGWLILLGIAMQAPGGMELITRDYVAYLTSLAILVGGEVDKIISILLVAILLAVATARARALLTRAVAGQAAASQLARFFSPDIAATILASDEILQPGAGRQAEAAAMFIDMRGFTRLAAALPPRELVELLGEYQRIAVPIVQRHRGSVMTYLGDGIMVTFGATRMNESYAADAIACTTGLLDTLGAWAAARAARGLPAPGIGIGVDVGTVTCGAIGDEGRLEYAVIGDAVNRAAKLQNHTKVEDVRALATAHALARAAAQGYAGGRCARMLAARPVAGVAEPIDLVVVE